jgi:hypothetical protein
MVHDNLKPHLLIRADLRYRDPRLDNVQPALSDFTEVTPTNLDHRLCEVAVGQRLKLAYGMSIFQKIKLSLLQTIEKLGENARDTH